MIMPQLLINTYVSLMYELKKMERYLRVNLLGPGPRLMKKEFTGPRSHRGRETALCRTLCKLHSRSGHRRRHKIRDPEGNGTDHAMPTDTAGLSNIITQKEWCDVIKLATTPPSYIDLSSTTAVRTSQCRTSLLCRSLNAIVTQSMNRPFGVNTTTELKI